MSESNLNPVPSPEQESPQQGDLWEAIQALAGRIGEVLTGPEGQRVKEELEKSAQDVIHQIDQALTGPAAESLKERVAALIRTVQEQLNKGR